MSRRGTLLWTVVGCVLAACGRPVVYPRSAEIRQGLGLRVRTNLSHGDATVRLAVADGANGEQPLPGGQTAEQIEATEYHGHASSPSNSYNNPLRFLGFVFNIEGDVGFAPTDWIEVNGWFGMQGTGFELRAQPLSERSGAPFSAALSVGGLTPSIVGAEGVGFRFGADLSRRIGMFHLLLGGYGSWGPRQRNLKADNFPDDGDGHLWPGQKFGATVLRNEWKLSVPAGLRLDISKGSAVVVGVVPEFTLEAEFLAGECVSICGDASLASFEQNFAIYFTVSGDFNFLGPHH